ncbi:hypothetical protein ACFLXT_00145 [Chloroflexota bacterium]
MIRLEKSEALQRKIRQDDPPDLAIPTWTLVREAVQTRRDDEAFNLLEYACDRTRAMHDSIIAFADDAMTQLAGFGEEELLKLLRKRYYDRVKNWLVVTPGVEETMQIMVENQRSHFTNLTVMEEPDRYVVTQDPCGSGGRLRRTRQVATTQKAYPWAWSRIGIPYYCIHCCVAWEVIATELRGYPLRLNLVGEKPEDPCIHLFYKKPELIPEEYFTRIGVTRAIK